MAHSLAGRRLGGWPASVGRDTGGWNKMRAVNRHPGFLVQSRSPLGRFFSRPCGRCASRALDPIPMRRTSLFGSIHFVRRGRFSCTVGHGQGGKGLHPSFEKSCCCGRRPHRTHGKVLDHSSQLRVASKEELGDIVSALQTTNQGRTAAIWVMAVIRNNEWITGEMKRDLCAITEQGVDDADFAALIFARFAHQSLDYHKALEKGLCQALVTRSGAEASRLTCKFGLIKARSSTSPDELRDTLKLWDRYEIILHPPGRIISGQINGRMVLSRRSGRASGASGPPNQSF